MLTDALSESISGTENQVSMHLLVPGAYRHYDVEAIVTAIGGSQCTFWCRVLTDNAGGNALNARSQSQCTFWCRVLTDIVMGTVTVSGYQSLNAPSGAGCLPTGADGRRENGGDKSQCTFWCRVLTDPVIPQHENILTGSQCTFWCRVLTDLFGRFGVAVNEARSQCTFWCRVLTDSKV